MSAADLTSPTLSVAQPALARTGQLDHPDKIDIHEVEVHTAAAVFTAAGVGVVRTQTCPALHQRPARVPQGLAYGDHVHVAPVRRPGTCKTISGDERGCFAVNNVSGKAKAGRFYSQVSPMTARRRRANFGGSKSHAIDFGMTSGRC